MSGDLVQHEDDRDDLTISYMLGFERGKDAAATALTLAQARIRELEGALKIADQIVANFAHGHSGDSPITQYRIARQALKDAPNV
jgi:hypothetical protein